MLTALRLGWSMAEDKRFELLKISPTRFPLLLKTVRSYGIGAEAGYGAITTPA
jgi:hypothetical protein